MSKLEQLLKEREDLEKEIEELRTMERDTALDTIRNMMDLHNLVPADLMLEPRKVRRSTGHVEPKYRHPETGATWTGRGRAPRWLEGKDKEAYRI